MKTAKVKIKITSVGDIFDSLGEPAARNFIATHVHMIDPRWNRMKIEEFLKSQNYGLHKNLETYADVAIEKFNTHG